MPLLTLTPTRDTSLVITLEAASAQLALSPILRGPVGPVTTPGGADKQVQINDGGVFFGNSGLVYDKATNSLTLGGLLRMAGATAGSPALKSNGAILESRLADDSGYAMNRASRQISIVAVQLGSGEGYWTPTQLGLQAAAAIAWVSGSDASLATQDLFLRRDAANTLAMRNGTNPQSFNLYNSYTDASNYNRLRFLANGSGLNIYADQAGTGLGLPLQLGTTAAQDVSIFTSNVNTWDFKAAGHLFARVDNTVDIGASGANRPRTGYFGTSVVAPILRTTPVTVATLPSAATAGNGARAAVTDANATLTAGIGTVVAAGGANSVPVVSNGTNWLIG
jgi:hypothetical protein